MSTSADDRLAIRLDPHSARYAQRTQSMTASEIRALFAVASRPEVVSLAGGMPDTSAISSEALAQVMAEVARTASAQALQYGGGQGLAELRTQLVHVMAAEHTHAHPDDLLVTTGGQQALDLLAKLFCDPGDVVLAEGPSYVGALSAFSAYQARVVHVGMDDQGMIPEQLEERLAQLAGRGLRPKLLYTVPTHQNPAGVSLSTARRERIVALAQAHDLLIIEDNPYGLIDFKGDPHPTLKSLDAERVVYIGTLSKIFAPGTRIGWIAAPASLRDKLILLKEAADLSHSNLAQMVAERWLATQPWQEQVEDFRTRYLARCHALIDEMANELPRGCTWNIPTGGMFVWATMPEGINTGELLAKAVSARVAYVPGRAFYADGGGSRQMRLNFSFAAEDRLREGVRRLAKVLHQELELLRAVYGTP